MRAQRLSVTLHFVSPQISEDFQGYFALVQIRRDEERTAVRQARQVAGALLSAGMDSYSDLHSRDSTVRARLPWCTHLLHHPTPRPARGPPGGLTHRSSASDKAERSLQEARARPADECLEQLSRALRIRKRLEAADESGLTACLVGDARVHAQALHASIAGLLSHGHTRPAPEVSGCSVEDGDYLEVELTLEGVSIGLNAGLSPSWTSHINDTTAVRETPADMTQSTGDTACQATAGNMSERAPDVVEWVRHLAESLGQALDLPILQLHIHALARADEALDRVHGAWMSSHSQRSGTGSSRRAAPDSSGAPASISDFAAAAQAGRSVLVRVRVQDQGGVDELTALATGRVSGVGAGLNRWCQTFKMLRAHVVSTGFRLSLARPLPDLLPACSDTLKHSPDAPRPHAPLAARSASPAPGGVLPQMPAHVDEENACLERALAAHIQGAPQLECKLSQSRRLVWLRADARHDKRVARFLHDMLFHPEQCRSHATGGADAVHAVESAAARNQVEEADLQVVSLLVDALMCIERRASKELSWQLLVDVPSAYLRHDGSAQLAGAEQACSWLDVACRDDMQGSAEDMSSCDEADASSEDEEVTASMAGPGENSVVDALRADEWSRRSLSADAPPAHACLTKHAHELAVQLDMVAHWNGQYCPLPCRDAVVNKLLASLVSLPQPMSRQQASQTSAACRLVMVEGPAGAGKTSVMARLIRQTQVWLHNSQQRQRHCLVSALHRPGLSVLALCEFIVRDLAVQLHGPKRDFGPHCDGSIDEDEQHRELGAQKSLDLPAASSAGIEAPVGGQGAEAATATETDTAETNAVRTNVMLVLDGLDDAGLCAVMQILGLDVPRLRPAYGGVGFDRTETGCDKDGVRMLQLCDECKAILEGRGNLTLLFSTKSFDSDGSTDSFRSHTLSHSVPRKAPPDLFSPVQLAVDDFTILTLEPLGLSETRRMAHARADQSSTQLASGASMPVSYMAQLRAFEQLLAHAEGCLPFHIASGVAALASSSLDLSFVALAGRHGQDALPDSTAKLTDAVLARLESLHGEKVVLAVIESILDNPTGLTWPDIQALSQGQTAGASVRAHSAAPMGEVERAHPYYQTALALSPMLFSPMATRPLGASRAINSVPWWQDTGLPRCFSADNVDVIGRFRAYVHCKALRRLMRTASLSPEEESYLEVLHYGVATDQVDRIPRAFTSLLGKAPLCAITSAPSGTLRPKLIRRPGPPSR